MNIRIIIPLVALVFYLPVHAQTSDGKNMGKLNLSAFVAKGFGIQYERQVGKRITVGLGYSNIPKSNIAFKSFIEKQVDDPDVKLGDFKLGTSIFTPEVRYYFGKQGAFHGFYLAPYARFGHYNIEGPVTYTSSTNVRRDLLFSGSLNTVTGGLMLGTCFKLTKQLYLDWWIIGASFGSANGDFIAQIPLPDEADQRRIEAQLNALNIPFTTIIAKANSNGAVITTTGGVVGIRGLGINLGIRF